jgi:hypothetical protein
MKSTTINILQQVKQQPRLGLPPAGLPPAEDMNINETSEQIKQIKADLKNLTEDIGGFAKTMLTNYAETMNVMSNSNLTFQTGLSSLIAIFDQYKNSMISVVKQSTWLEQRNKILNTSLGITSKQAAKMGDTYDRMAESLQTSGDQLRHYAKNLAEQIPGIKGAIAGNKEFAKTLFMTQDIMTKQLNMSATAAANFELYAAGMGKTGIQQLGALDAFTTKFEKASGMIGVFKDISGEIADLGSDIQMAYGKMPGNLELAVMKSRTLGMKFSEIENMASNMLNIEDSVNKELEYQLLSGKRLVDQQGKSITEKLRMAKITGDANKMAEATADIYTSQKDTLEGNNHFAKQALADMMGMTQAQMMKAYQTQKLIKTGMGEDKVTEILAMDPAQYAAAIKDMSDDQQTIFNKLKQDQSQLTTDEKMGELLDMKRTIKVVQVTEQKAALTKEEKEKGITVQEKLVTGARDQVIGADGKGGAVTKVVGDMLETLVNEKAATLLGTTQTLGKTAEAFQSTITTLTGKLPVLGTAFSHLTAKLTEFTNAAFGTAGAAKGGAVGIAATDVTVNEQKDALIMNDGLIKFNPRDKFMQVDDSTMIAGTNVDGNKKLARAISGGGDTKIDTNLIVAAIKQGMKDINFNLTLDGYNLKKALEFSNRSINKI